MGSVFGPGAIIMTVVSVVFHSIHEKCGAVGLT
jgi:hypothetical protein